MMGPIPADLTSLILLSIQYDVLVILNFVFRIVVLRFSSFGTEENVEMLLYEYKPELSVGKPSFLRF